MTINDISAHWDWAQEVRFMDFQEKRILGRTGIAVSRLGLAGGYGVPAAGVERAFHEYGVNYFYWSTPRRAGMRDGLRELIKGYRDDITIVLQSYDHIGLTVQGAVQKGLKTLGTDYADVILLGLHYWHPPGKVINGALKLKKRGLVRFIAMSGHNRKLFGKIAGDDQSPIDIFMVRYNAAHRGAEGDIFPRLPEENRPGITTYTATRWGQLLKPKKMPPDEKPMTAADCYRFALSNPNVDLCLMGPSSEREMEEGLTALTKGPFSKREMERARKIGDYLHG